MLEDGIIFMGVGPEEMSMALLLSHLQGVDLSSLCFEFVIPQSPWAKEWASMVS